MAPEMSGFQQGERMPNDGTPQDGRCICCGERFTRRYWSGRHGGPYCAQHFPSNSAEKD